MPIIEIDSLSHPGTEVFSTLTEAQLRNNIEPEKGIFIAESPKVINVALNAGYQPVSLLCERKHIDGDAADIISRCGDIPVYTGTRDLLAQLTGYTLTRGVLCAMRRPAPLSMEEVCRDARRIVVINGVVDTTNIGAIFRSAAALGIDAVLLRSAEPTCRKGVDGFCIPRAVDMDGRSANRPQPTWLPHCRYGAYRELRLYRPSVTYRRTKACHSNGHRRRWTA